MEDTENRFDWKHTALVICGAVGLLMILYQVPKQHADDAEYAYIAMLTMAVGAPLLYITITAEANEKQFNLWRAFISCIIAAAGLTFVVIMGEISEESGKTAAIAIAAGFILFTTARIYWKQRR